MTADLQLLAADGATWLPLMLVPESGPDGTPRRKVVSDAIQASLVSTPITDQLVELGAKSFIRGIGLDYDAAYGVFTRAGIDADGEELPDEESGGYACPAGEVAEVDIALGTNNGGVCAFAEFVGNLYVAQSGGVGANTARILALSGGAGPATVSLALGVGEVFRGMCVSDNGAGSVQLYAFSSDGGTQNGRVHRFNGATWTSTAAGTFGTNGRGAAASVMWRDRQGIRYQRIVTISGVRTIAYTKPAADPMLPASWVEGVLMNTAYQLRDVVVGGEEHAFISSDDGVFDFDEVGNSYNLLSEAVGNVQTGNGFMVLYHDGSLYYGVGNGVVKINLENGRLQEQPGQCAPGAYTRGENPIGGYAVAGCVDMNGWVGVALFNGTTRQSFICWGKSREQLGIKSPNPLIWHGPEAFTKELADVKVTRMKVSSLTGGARLWIGTIKDTAPNTPRLFYQLLPRGNSPSKDVYSRDTWRSTTGQTGSDMVPYSRIDFLPTNGGNRGSSLSLFDHTFSTRGPLSPSTKLTFYARADPAPGSVVWGSGTDITASPTQTIRAAGANEGSVIGRRVDFVAPSGGATPPIVPFLEGMWTTTWVTAPQFGVRDLAIEYGVQATDWENTNPLPVRGADQITQQLALLLGKRTTMRDAWGTTWSVRVMQLFPRELEAVPDGVVNKKTVRAQLRLAMLSTA